MTTPQPAVDLAGLMDRIGGDESLLRELVALYLDDEQRLLEELASALREGDGAALHRSAHTVKGAVSNFCAPAAWSAAQAVETAGREGRLGEAPALLAVLVAELDRVREALSMFVVDRS